LPGAREARASTATAGLSHDLRTDASHAGRWISTRGPWLRGCWR
jgi:hypothetical protein